MSFNDLSPSYVIGNVIGYILIAVAIFYVARWLYRKKKRG
ncbi:FeoB-associated Cys-rich membrane protein [Candidatus Bathyarchaeota archaeon]|nr:FeoB-associated Cys-rich membrane protein [Candidatus Bathyarchaeota archaeon]